MLNTCLPPHPTTPLLGICPKATKVSVHTRTCVRMFIAILFVTAEREKQNWASLGEQIGKDTVVFA